MNAPLCVAAAAAAYRAAPGPRLEDQLAVAVCIAAARAGRGFGGVRASVRDEVVQDRSERLVRHIREGRAIAGKEDGLVRRAVRNALRDQLRRARRDVLEHAGELGEVPTDPLPARRRPSGFLELIDEVRSQDQREVLRWLFVAERPLNQLVERDLLARVEVGALDASDETAVARARRTARARRDKQWQRGREALLRLVILRHRSLLLDAPVRFREVLEAVYVRRCAPATVDAAELSAARGWFLRRLLD